MQLRREFVGRGVAAALVSLAAVAGCDDGGNNFADAGRDAPGVDAAPSPIGMLPASIALSNTDCGAATTQTFTVMNSGNADLTYSLAFSDPAFTVNPSSGTIVAGASATFTVTVDVPQDATAGTALTATLTATSNLPGSPHNVPVTVTPRGAHITLTPGSVGFGQVEAGTTSTPSTVLVANTGNAPATVAIAAPGGEFNRLFGTGGSLVLAGGQSADASFTYAPTAIGADSASAALTITGTHCGAVPSSIALTGTGEVTGGVLIGGTPVDFGNRTCGSSSSTATVTLTNTAEIAASFTATLPTDAEGDHARYTVLPASGTIPANMVVTLTVTRSAIALPFQPRAINTLLRIHVDLPTDTDTDVPVQQTLTGPFLTATPTTQNFGYAPVGISRSGPITINNTGNATATIQSNATAPFSLALPAMINPQLSGNGTMTYQPTALGTTSETATVTAAAACSSPVSLSFTAGDGPYVSQFYTYGTSASCPVSAPFGSPIYVSNGGNQPLNMSCIDRDMATSDFNAVFMANVIGAGSGGQVDVTVSPPSPLRAGSTTMRVRCTSNEPIGDPYDVDFTRDIVGADLQLSSTAPLDFTCGPPDRQFYTIASASTSNATPFVAPVHQLSWPLAHDFTQTTLAPSTSYQNSVTTYGGGSGQQFHGIADLCDLQANPGDIVFTGSVGVGSGSGICSVTPATLPVVLRAGTPLPQ